MGGSVSMSKGGFFFLSVKEQYYEILNTTLFLPRRPPTAPILFALILYSQFYAWHHLCWYWMTSECDTPW